MNYEKKKVLVAVSEGVKALNGQYLIEKYASNSSNDAFGHIQLGGCSSIITNIVSKNLNLPTRSIELNLPQRCASHIASKTDINEAFACGKKAVKFAISGKSNLMVSMHRLNSKKYKIDYKEFPLNKVANQIKYFPNEWIINGNDIANEFIIYSLPLIQGETKQEVVNGLPRFCKLKKEKVNIKKD